MKMLVAILAVYSGFAWGDVQNYGLHRTNQQILAEVIQEELTGKNLSPQEKADYLSQIIAEIGKKVLKRGFKPSAYSCSHQFTADPLWEGKSIPLTFFVNIWPPEDYARAQNPNSKAYASNIHGHPIPCALTVLSRSIVQIPYQPVSQNHAKFLTEETLHLGDAVIDTTEEPFVHKMVCREKGNKPAITLHAYGATTAREVNHIFNSTFKEPLINEG